MQGVKDMNRNDKYYVNVKEVMMKLLPKPTRKPVLDYPVISVTVGLWSPITW